MTVKTEAYQVGLSGTPSQNFHLTAAAADGTMQLYRGNPGAAIGGAVLAVDAANRLSYPGEPAWITVAVAVASTAGALTSANASFTYKKIGTLLVFRAVANIVTNGTGSGQINLALPFAPVGAEWNFIGRESAIYGTPLFGLITVGSPLNLGIQKIDQSYPGVNGAVLNITGSYQVAA